MNQGGGGGPQIMLPPLQPLQVIFGAETPLLRPPFFPRLLCLHPHTCCTGYSQHFLNEAARMELTSLTVRLVTVFLDSVSYMTIWIR